jgi:hypothetical protein
VCGPSPAATAVDAPAVLGWQKWRDKAAALLIANAEDPDTAREEAGRALLALFAGMVMN